MIKTKKVGKHYLLDPALIGEAKKALGARTETETIERALEETIQRAKFQRLVSTSKGKYRFEDFDFGDADEQQARHR